MTDPNDQEREASRGEHVVPGALWQHKRDPRLTKEVARVTENGKVLGPGPGGKRARNAIKRVERALRDV